MQQIGKKAPETAFRPEDATARRDFLVEGLLPRLLKGRASASSPIASFYEYANLVAEVPLDGGGGETLNGKGEEDPGEGMGGAVERVHGSADEAPRLALGTRGPPCEACGQPPRAHGE